MKKILASILALCLIFSAFGTALFTVSAEETVTEPETGTETEVVEQTPIFTATVADWTYTYGGKTTVAIKDSTLFDEAWQLLNPDTRITTTGYSSVFSDKNKVEVLSIADAAEWLKTESGQMRFWVKIPWREGTPELSYYFGIGYNVSYDVVTENEDGSTTTTTKIAYPETHATVNISADGLWHEIRISVSDLTSTTVFDSYAANETTVVNGFYALRARAVNEESVMSADNSWQIAPILEYYNEAITAEINDGNIVSEVYLVDSNDTGTGLAGLTYDNPKITDNKFYRTARRLTRTEEEWSAGNIYPFSKTATSDVAELKGWFDNQGEMRTFIKNASDNDITVTIGVKGNFAHSTHTDKYAAIGKSVTLPANEWTEVRISYSDAKPSEKTQDLFTTSDTYYKYWMYIEKNDTMFQNVGDALYITPMEIYNRNIVEDVTTDFEREYKEIALKNTVGTWRQDGNKMLDRTETVSEELPFTGKVVTYTANETFNIENFAAGQIGFTGGTVNCADFAEWAYHNPDAEMRMWVKSTKDITLLFEVLAYDNTDATNRSLLLTLNVIGSPEWQEIRLTRSALEGQSWSQNAFNEVFTTETNETSSMNIFLRDVIAGVSKGDSFSLAQRLEFFSHEAYDKGDLNRDGAVNVLDLVRTKKFIANAETSFINGDINSDGKLTADDMTYLRKWMITGAWN